MQDGAATMKNSMEIFQNIKNRTTIGFSKLTSGYLSKRTEIRASKRYNSHVHCSTIYNRQDVEIETKCSLTDERIFNNVNYLVVQKRESLQYETFINVENIKLSEMSQSQKDKYCIIPLT